MAVAAMRWIDEYRDADKVQKTLALINSKMATLSNYSAR